MKPKYYILIILILLGLLVLPRLAFAALFTSSSLILRFASIILIILIEAFLFWLLTEKVFRIQIKFSKILLATFTGYLLWGVLLFISAILLIDLFATAMMGGLGSSSLISIVSLFVPYMIIKTAIYRLFLRKTDIGKSNLLKISFIVNLIAFILLTILFFSAYRPGIEGKIIDAATKEPLKGIKIEREITFEICGFECSNYPAASSSTITDKNGIFKFWPKIIFKPSGKFYGEGLAVNRRASMTPAKIAFENRIIEYKKIVYMPDNIEYYYDYKDCFAKENLEMKLMSCENKYIIELIPFVDSIEECRDNEMCIEYNSFRIAAKNKDANACFTYAWSATCLRVVALLKEDPSICNLCKDIKIRKGYVPIEETDKEYCRKKCLSCFGTDNYGREKNFCSKEQVCSVFYGISFSGTEERKLCLSLFEK